MCKLVMIHAGTYIKHDIFYCIFCIENKSEIPSSSNTDVDFYTIIRRLIDSVFNIRLCAECKGLFFKKARYSTNGVT